MRLNSPAKLRIVVASEQYLPSRGGTEITTFNLAKGLKELEQEVLVVAPGPSMRKTFLDVEDGLRTLRVRSVAFQIAPGLRVSWFPYRVIKQYIDEFQPDIIQAQNPFMLGTALMRYAKRYNVPLVGGCHLVPEANLFNLMWLGPIYHRLARWWWRRFARLYSRATAVVSPTQTIADLLKRFGLQGRAVAISNGVKIRSSAVINKQDLRRSLKLAERYSFVTLGRVSPDKRLEQMLAGVAKIKDCDFQLVIIGGGHDKYRMKLRRLVKRLGISDKVIFTGFLPKEEQKFDYLQSADCFVITSPQEAQSIATLEAMLCSLPIIALNLNALPELAKPGENGWLFEYGDIDGLAKVMLAAMDDPERLKSFGRASRALVQHHDIKQMPENYLSLYYELLRPEAP